MTLGLGVICWSNAMEWPWGFEGIALWSKVLLCDARYWFAMQGIALGCEARYCFVKQGVALWCKVLLCDARYLWCTVLLCDARYCFVMQCIALWCKILLCDTRYGFVTHGIALWHTVLLYKVCVFQGAIEGCRNGFLLFCTSLMSCDDASLSAIPASILNQVIFAESVFVLVFASLQCFCWYQRSGLRTPDVLYVAKLH